MSYGNYHTGIGSRHTVQFPEPDHTLTSWEVSAYIDPSRGKKYATVSLWHLGRDGGHSSETIVVYNVDDEVPGWAIRTVAEAISIASMKWELRRWKHRKIIKELNRIRNTASE